MTNRKIGEKTIIILATLLLWTAAAAAQEKPMITGVKNKSDASDIKLEISLSGKCEHTSFTLSDPARLVIDFPGADTGLVPFQAEFEDPVLQSVRIGRPTPETVRVVLDLKYLIPFQIQAAGSGHDLVVSLDRNVESRSNTINVLPGISYTAKMDMTDEGPMSIHIMDVNLNDPDISIYVGIGEDRLGGKEPLSSLVKRKGAAIGVNGGYFSMDSGLPIDLLIVHGKVLLLPDRYRGFFGIDKSGSPVFMRPNTEISLQINKEHPQYVHRLNWPPADKELTIFTPEYGKNTNTGKDCIEAVIRNNKIVDFTHGDSEIPEDGVVLSGHKSSKDFFDKLKKGDSAVMMISSYPDIKDVEYGISAGPMLVKDGELQDKLVEDFTISSGIVAKANPRTAVGRTNNNHLIFAVVEGRNTRSIGMTLDQLGKLMQSLGAVDAINLDGGGSSELVIGEKIMNQLPKDEERPIANAILIFHK